MASPWSTQADIETLVGLQAVIQASNDSDSAGDVNETNLNAAISRADTRIKFAISKKYDTSAIDSGNDWIRWCSATLATAALFRRRGNPIPPGIEDDLKEFERQLQLISEGNGEIPDYVPRVEPGLAMSNVRIDPRYQTSKIRVQQTISAGQQTSQKPRRTDYNSQYPEL